MQVKGHLRRTVCHLRSPEIVENTQKKGGFRGNMSPRPSGKWLSSLTPEFIPFRPADLGCARPQCPNPIGPPQRSSGRQASYCSDDCRAKARQEYANTELAFVYLARVVDSYHRAATGATPLTLTAADNRQLQNHLRDLRDALGKLQEIGPGLDVTLRRHVIAALAAAGRADAVLNSELATRAGTAYAAARSASRGHRSRA